jgi:uncharacterized protein
MAAATSFGNDNIVSCLLQNGADVNAVDVFGSTALMVATKSARCMEKVQLLLECGGDVDATSRNGETALMAAARSPGYQKDQIIKLLLHSGGNVNAVDEKGETALTKAAEHCQNCDQVDVGDSDSSSHDGENVDASYAIRKNAVKILLSSGVSVQDRENALALALSRQKPDEELVQMLSVGSGTWEEMVSSHEHDGDTIMG